MKGLWIGLLACVLLAGQGFAQDRNARVEVDIGNAYTFGDFTYDDATIDIDSEWFNPHGSVEIQFADTPWALGLELAMSENTFDGEYEEGDGDSGFGTLDMERREIALYVRFVPSENVSLRLGYRNFDYDISNADVTQFNDGVLSERDVDGTADGQLSTGIDAQLTLMAGAADATQFGVTFGYTYFIDAEYDWSYTEVIGAAQTPRSGSATADAHSLRLRPEVSFPLSDGMRLYFDWLIAGTAWDATLSDDEPDYPGYDVYSGISAGLRFGADI